MFFLKSFSATVLLAIVITFSICLKAAAESAQTHVLIVSNWCSKQDTPASARSNIVVTQVDSKNGNRQLVPDPPGETTGKLGSGASYFIRGPFDGHVRLSSADCNSPNCVGHAIIVLALHDKLSEGFISVNGTTSTSPVAVSADFQFLVAPFAQATIDADPSCFAKRICNGESCNVTPAICGGKYTNVSVVINFCDVPASLL